MEYCEGVTFLSEILEILVMVSKRELNRRGKCVKLHRLNLEKILRGLNGHPLPPVKKMARTIAHVCQGHGLEIRVFERFPPLLGLSLDKIDGVVEYLVLDVGISYKAISRFPSALGYSVTEKSNGNANGKAYRRRKRRQGALRPKIDYLKGLGIDIVRVIERAPQVLGLSVEGNLKPKVNYLMEKGYPIKVLERDPRIFTYSLRERIAPRVEFLQGMEGRERALPRTLSLSDEKFCEEFAGCTVEEFRRSIRMINSNGYGKRNGNGVSEDAEDRRVCAVY